MPDKNLRVLVADDEEFTQVILQQLLTSSGYEVLTAGSVSDALLLLNEFDPHVIVSDLNFGPGPTGAELLTRIHQDAPWIGQVILTAHASPELAIAASGDIPKHAVYLVKSQLDSVQNLISAIESSLANSEPYVHAIQENSGLIILSQSQAEVLRMISEGLTNSAIAEQRKTSIRATEGLIQRTFSALGIAAEADQNPRVIAARMWQMGKVIVK